MASPTQRSGRCLCGTIRFTAARVSDSVGACHCSMCRRWGGGPLLAVDCGTEVAFEGAGNLSVYDSSPWAERGFCAKCGTHMFYRLKGSHQYIMPAGLFEDDSAFVLDQQIFIDDKPGYYDFANQTVTMTGAEVFAKYAPPSD
jgi:hypothetical protein